MKYRWCLKIKSEGNILIQTKPREKARILKRDGDADAMCRRSFCAAPFHPSAAAIHPARAAGAICRRRLAKNADSLSGLESEVECFKHGAAFAGITKADTGRFENRLRGHAIWLIACGCCCRSSAVFSCTTLGVIIGMNATSRKRRCKPSPGCVR